MYSESTRFIPGNRLSWDLILKLKLTLFLVVDIQEKWGCISTRFAIAFVIIYRSVFRYKYHISVSLTDNSFYYLIHLFNLTRCIKSNAITMQWSGNLTTSPTLQRARTAVRGTSLTDNIQGNCGSRNKHLWRRNMLKMACTTLLLLLPLIII